MVFQNNLLAGASGVTGAQAAFDTTLIGNSAWYDGSLDYMNSPSFSAQADPTCFIFATWIQLLDFSIGSFGQYLWSAERPSNYASIRISNTNKLIAYSNPGQFESSMIFRDIGWYHIICSYKGPDDTIRMFVNGNEITVTKSNSNTLASNLEPVHASHTHRIGAYFSGATGGTLATAKSYMAQTVFLDGFSFQDGDVTISDFLDTFTFGTNGSQFIPKTNSDLATLAGTAGANSYVIDYADSSNLGNDISSKNNNFTLVSMDSANQSTHTPSRTYLQLNPLQKFGTADLSEGNTRVGVDVSDSIRGTKYATTGKKYLEVTLNTVNNSYIGVANGSNNPSSFASSNVACLQKDGDIYINDSPLGSGRSKTFGTGDVVGILIDADAKKFWQSVNGTFNSLDRDSSITLSASDILAGTGGFDLSGLTGDDGNYVLHIGNSDGTSADVSINGGHKAFSHTPPTGYTGWASDDYTAPDFQGIDYFDTTLYEGNGFNQRVGDFVPFTDTYTVDKSAMFDDGDRRYLAKTFDSGDATATSDPGGSNSAKATISFWIKYNRSVGSGDQYIISTANTAQTQRFTVYRNEQSAEDQFIINMNPGPKMFKAPVQSALLSEQEWSNVVINVDLDNSTGADKVKMFVNGVQITSVDTTYQSASNSNYFLFANEDHFIGNLAPASAGYTGFCLDSYLAEMHVIDGHVKAPTDFGQVDTATNRWVAKDYKTNVGAYGNRGFYMAFDSTFASGNGAGTDSSGNGFNFTESFVSGGSAWATTDQFTDTPSKNFATWDSGRKAGNTLSEGNLKVTGDSGADIDSVLGTLFVSSGKYYWEIERDADPAGSDRFRAGVAIDSYPLTTSMDSRTDAWGISENGQKLGGGLPLTNYGDATTTGDFIGVALDMDRNAIYFSKNGTWMNSASASGIADGTDYSKAAFSNIYANVAPFVQTYDTQVATLRTASGRWEGTAPTGFLELNQDNLDDTASKITAWAWIKNQDSDTDNHMLFDRVRGVGKDLQLFASSTVAEATDANTLQRFLQRGAQVGNDGKVNTVNESYTLWQWLAGDSATTGTVIPADNPPSIASTVITADAGHFSVGTFTGAGGSSTIGHGLSAAPEFFLVKRIGTSGSGWFVYSKSTTDPNNKFLRLQGTNAEDSASGAWTPGATTMGLNESSLNGINTSGVEHLFIAFRSVPGVCKIGTFTGNFSHDGPYIHLGFKPAWYMTKDITTVSSWYIYDSANYPFNSTSVFHTLANNSNAGGAGAFNEQDFLSDGVKNRGQNNDTNESGSTFLYLAMAEIGGNGTLPPIYSR